jgi:muramoyltetrapeptide carboxypeptidase
VTGESFLRPRALAKGSRIAVIAPASPFDPEDLEGGVRELRSLGFEPVYEESVHARRGYVAGDARVRVEALRRAWFDPEVAGLIAVRGGYGSAQLLPLLDAAEFRRQPKVLVGYSDVTAILAFLTTQCGLVTFHGPMLAGKLAKGPAAYDRDSFERCLCRSEPYGSLAPDSLEIVRSGEAAGPLVGGTLTQLVASLGTPFAFSPPDGHVLFIDEVGERPYRLDRMLTQLAQSGLLARAAAVVFGELPGCDEPGGRATARAVAADALRDFSGPVLFGLPSGHTTRPALTLPFGVRTRVIAAPRPRLVIEEPAVVV